MGQLEDNLPRLLRESGASMVGFADLGGLPPGPRHNLESAIWIGVALDPRVVADIVRGPTKLYEIEYRRVNAILEELTRVTSAFLKRQGFEAIARKPTDEDVDWIDLTTPLPHKTVATRAGVGWIGKCGLLVTEEFGSAIRMAVVLTDAYVEGAAPVGASMCGECEECVKLCPAGAAKGPDWIKGMEREEFYDVHACHDHILRLRERGNIVAKICGVCIAVCPYTIEYLRRAGID